MLVANIGNLPAPSPLLKQNTNLSYQHGGTTWSVETAIPASLRRELESRISQTATMQHISRLQATREPPTALVTLLSLSPLLATVLLCLFFTPRIFRDRVWVFRHTRAEESFCFSDRTYSNVLFILDRPICISVYFVKVCLCKAGLYIISIYLEACMCTHIHAFLNFPKFLEKTT